MKNEIIIFENQDVKLEVNLKDETVWLTANQMAKLFKRDYKTIRKHINNAFDEELEINSSTIANFATVKKEGNREVIRNIQYYNLDVIISVGYRVRSTEGTKFRKWATTILKDHLLKGYSVNKQRLEYLEKTVKLIDIASRIEENDTKDVLQVINRYTKALNLLDDYDHKRIIKPNVNTESIRITYSECKKIIKDLKLNETSKLFALEINNELYPSVEEKASNLLYLIIKNHIFIDNNTLVAITLLIAESNPKEKEIIIDLVMNFLAN